jgi:hypothetical protein
VWSPAICFALICFALIRIGPVRTRVKRRAITSRHRAKVEGDASKA